MYNGLAAIFEMPWDIHREGIDIEYNNLKIHSQYYGSIVNPGMVTHFNSHGSYTHARLGVDFNAGVSIDLSGGNISIGLDLTGASDVRTAKVYLTYYPK